MYKLYKKKHSEAPFLGQITYAEETYYKYYTCKTRFLRINYNNLVKQILLLKSVKIISKIKEKK